MQELYGRDCGSVEVGEKREERREKREERREKREERREKRFGGIRLICCGKRVFRMIVLFFLEIV